MTTHPHHPDMTLAVDLGLKPLTQTTHLLNTV